MNAPLSRAWDHLRRPILRDTLAVLLVQICSKGTLHLVLICMAHALSVQDFARYGFFLVTTAVLAGYLALGLPLAASKVVAAGRPGPLLHDQVVTIVLLSAAASVLGMAAAPFYMPLLVPASIGLNSGWVIAGALAGAWAGVAQGALYSLHKFNRAIAPVLLGSTSLVLGAVAAAAAGKVVFLLLGAVGSAVVGFVGTAIALRDQDLWPARPRMPSLHSFRSVLAIALPGMGIAAIFATFNWMIARSLIEHQAKPIEFNMFSIGLQWFALVLFIPLALGQAVFPRYVRMASSNGAKSLSTVLRPVVLTSATLLCAAPVAALATPLLVWFYGGHYAFPPSFVATVFLAAALAGVQNLIGNYVIAATKGVSTWLVANLIALALCIMLTALFPPSTAFHAMLELVGCYGCLAMLATAYIGLDARRLRARPLVAEPARQ